ncbi:MAG: sodium:solute symporter [Bacteroidales bacterium]|nr:sodium:solute symporter [Bacteroidales bacterium]
MSSTAIAITIALYFAALFVISHITSRNATNRSFFIGNRESPWYLVAIAMVGTSISGVTFISVPGWVGSSQFTYLQMVLGFLLGYVAVANVLLPLYYRLNLTSIYTYLEGRFGRVSYKTGAVFFLLSRAIGTSFRLFIVASVLQLTVFDGWGIPFWLTVSGTVALIWLYTRKGGVKTVLWTDTFQTIAMLSAVVLCVYFIAQRLDLSFAGVVRAVADSELARIWVFDDLGSRHHFLKQFLSGAFITIVMTGLDQDMMQKNLSCRSLPEAQKNMYWYGFAFLPVNLLFLSLGVLLYIFAERYGIALPAHSDDLFPLIATGGLLPPIVGVLFVLGLSAAAYSSADSALTALTTSATIDLLSTKHMDEQTLSRTRQRTHLAVAAVVVAIILLFRSLNDRSVIDAIYTVAGYTYGPLLGLYAFGLFTRRAVRDRLVPMVTVASPIVCYAFSQLMLNRWGYAMGYELLMLNGALTFAGLWLIGLGMSRTAA